MSLSKMIFQAWIEAVSVIFNQSTTNTAIMMSLIIIILLDILTIVNMKDGSIDAMFFLNTACCILFIFMKWLPVFVGTVMAVIFGLIGAEIARDRLMGGG